MKKESKRRTTLDRKVSFVLRILVIACMIFQLIRGEIGNALLCVLTLVLFTLPYFFQRTFKFRLPVTFEVIVYLFIFAAEILGEIYNFYGNIIGWDTLLHAINGFICAGVGVGLIEMLNSNSSKIKLSPLYVALIAFCTSMTIGVCWEFFEYAADNLVKTDMQKDSIVQTISTVTLNPNGENKAVIIKDIDKTVLYDKDGEVLAVIEGGYLDIGLNDTMKDLMVNMVGAVVFSIFGFFYELNNDKYKFAGNFIPRKNDKPPSQNS